jgi:hypothetical protein
VDDRPGPCFGSLVSASHVCVCGVHPLFCQSADYGCDSVLTICVPVLRLSFCFELIVAVCVCVCDFGSCLVCYDGIVKIGYFPILAVCC